MFGRDGTVAGPEIDVGGPGDPIIVLDRGLLYTALSGASTGVVITEDGTRSASSTRDSPLTTVIAGPTPTTNQPAGGPSGGTQPSASPSTSPPPTVGPSTQPPAVPRTGDIVITGYEETSSCVRGCRYHYTVFLDPPPAWRDFSGTCSLRVIGGINRTISCGATSGSLGLGNGAVWTVSVEACLDSCVLSNRIEVQTTEPQPDPCPLC